MVNENKPVLGTRENPRRIPANNYNWVDLLYALPEITPGWYVVWEIQETDDGVNWKMYDDNERFDLSKRAADDAIKGLRNYAIENAKSDFRRENMVAQRRGSGTYNIIVTPNTTKAQIDAVAKEAKEFLATLLNIQIEDGE
jgi:hypothetical protein